MEQGLKSKVAIIGGGPAGCGPGHAGPAGALRELRRRLWPGEAAPERGGLLRPGALCPGPAGG